MADKKAAPRRFAPNLNARRDKKERDASHALHRLLYDGSEAAEAQSTGRGRGGRGKGDGGGKGDGRGGSSSGASSGRGGIQGGVGGNAGGAGSPRRSGAAAASASAAAASSSADLSRTGGYQLKTIKIEEDEADDPGGRASGRASADIEDGASHTPGGAEARLPRGVGGGKGVTPPRCVPPRRAGVIGVAPRHGRPDRAAAAPVCGRPRAHSCHRR